MTRTAMICEKEYVVKNLIELEADANWSPPEGIFLVNCDNVSVSQGFIYDTETGSFTAPPPVEPEEELISKVPPIDFFERFTEQEQLKIVELTLTNAVVKLWYDKLMASKEVMLFDVKLSESLDNLVSLGALSENRRLEILPIQNSGITVL